MSFQQANNGKRRSRINVPGGGGGGIQATILPSQTGCRLGPEAEACANGRTTITLGQYLSQRERIPAT